jgi:hypothetical protein
MGFLSTTGPPTFSMGVSMASIQGPLFFFIAALMVGLAVFPP